MSQLTLNLPHYISQDKNGNIVQTLNICNKISYHFVDFHQFILEFIHKF